MEANQWHKTAGNRHDADTARAWSRENQSVASANPGVGTSATAEATAGVAAKLASGSTQNALI